LLISRNLDTNGKVCSLGRGIYFIGGIGIQKLNISCQDGKSLRRVENGRYDFQIITFQEFKNAPVIAETITIVTAVDNCLASMGWREYPIFKDLTLLPHA